MSVFFSKWSKKSGLQPVQPVGMKIKFYPFLAFLAIEIGRDLSNKMNLKKLNLREKNYPFFPSMNHRNESSERSKSDKKILKHEFWKFGTLSPPGHANLKIAGPGKPWPRVSENSSGADQNKNNDKKDRKNKIWLNIYSYGGCVN